MKYTTIIVPFGTLEQTVLETYCLGKSKIWNLFHGWRKANDKGCYYNIGVKDLDSIYSIIKDAREWQKIKNDFI